MILCRERFREMISDQVFPDEERGNSSVVASHQTVTLFAAELLERLKTRAEVVRVIPDGCWFVRNYTIRTPEARVVFN